MVHLDTPGPDTGIFTTEEVRPRSKPCKSTSRIISLPRNHYKEPPNLAAGFRSLDLSCEAPVRANLVADKITTDSFRVTLETWGEKSLLYSASATWIEHKAYAKDCLFGQFDTHDLPENRGASKRGAQQENSREFVFPQPFKDDCEVICWLNRIDMASGDRNYRIRAYATDVSRKGFTAHIDTWGDSLLYGGAMCWIAFPKRKRYVQAGSFQTGDVRSWSNPIPETSSQVKFEEGVFKSHRPAPTVLCALNFIDMAGNADLRVSVDVNDVDTQGFRWSLKTFEDSTLYAAGASWIALGFA
ncbi:hypothetical protein KCU61_g9122, partial [Aureobasidium melanogenum]